MIRDHCVNCGAVIELRNIDNWYALTTTGPRVWLHALGGFYCTTRLDTVATPAPPIGVENQ